MKILIIEDELLAQAKLESLLMQVDSSIQVIGKLGSVKSTLAWLSENNPPDLAFVDIQLSDDHSFEIFRKFPIQFPVVFTTAFDKYLLESFEFHSIDYLLKPITEDKIKRSLSKFKILGEYFLQGNILKLIKEPVQRLKHDRIVVRKGTDFIALPMNEIAYFFTEHKIVFAKDFNDRQYIVDKTLGELETLVDASCFFRLNRKFLSNRKAIEKFKPDNGKILITIKPPVKEEIHVSKEGAPEFRKWIGKE